MNELLETERAYVEELLCVLQVCIFPSPPTCVQCCFPVFLILEPNSLLIPLCEQGYASEMDNPAMVPLIPAPLQNKKEVLFGNMPEIYHFHRR